MLPLALGWPRERVPERSCTLVVQDGVVHWGITGWYMTPNEEYDGLTPRAYLKGKSWEAKVRVGHKALIEAGVLTP